MIAERKRKRDREREFSFSLCFWLQSVQKFIRYFCEEDILEWRCLSSPNCNNTQEIIFAFSGRFKCYRATVWIQCYKQYVIVFFSCSDDVDPTRIIVPPLSLDVTTGQSLVLPCEVSSDSSLSPKFKWFFNGKAIDFSKQEHFEMIGKVFMAKDRCSKATLTLLFKQRKQVLLYLNLKWRTRASKLAPYRLSAPTAPQTCLQCLSDYSLRHSFWQPEHLNQIFQTWLLTKYQQPLGFSFLPLCVFHVSTCCSSFLCNLSAQPVTDL